MAKLTKVLMAGLLLSLMLISTAAAGDFSPKLKFQLTDTRVKANPQMKVHLEQDDGEEELAHVTLSIPKGFKLPADAKIPNGDALGTGSITINAGPGCNPSVPAGGGGAKAPISPPATLTEKDRTDAQADAGVYAVWFLDISGVTSVTLEITGSPTTGWKLDGDIPANDNTCPGLVFDLNVNSQSASGVKLIVNPKVAGNKVFKGAFTSLNSGAVAKLKQTIKIKKK
jgi:hypothetical protein